MLDDDVPVPVVWLNDRVRGYAVFCPLFLRQEELDSESAHLGWTEVSMESALREAFCLLLALTGVPFHPDGQGRRVALDLDSSVVITLSGKADGFLQEWRLAGGERSGDESVLECPEDVDHRH